MEDEIEFYCIHCGGELTEVLLRYRHDVLPLQSGGVFVMEYADRYTDVCFNCT